MKFMYLNCGLKQCQCIKMILVVMRATEYKAAARETRIFTEIKRDTVYFNIVVQKLWNKLSLNWCKNSLN